MAYFRKLKSHEALILTKPTLEREELHYAQTVKKYAWGDDAVSLQMLIRDHSNYSIWNQTEKESLQKSIKIEHMQSI